MYQWALYLNFEQSEYAKLEKVILEDASLMNRIQAWLDERGIKAEIDADATAEMIDDGSDDA